MRKFRTFTTALRTMLSVGLLVTLALPAHAIDARKLHRDLLPVKATVSAPSGASGLCRQYAWACARTGRVTTIDAAALAIVQKVNQRANQKVRPVSDQRQWSIAEKWSLPTNRGGDCEDFAIYKKKMLIEAGFSPDQLLIATVLDRQNRSHAVLVLRTGTQDLVLDNLTGRIKPWRDTGYTFLRLQDPRQPNRWVAVFAGGIMDRLS
jgi:predicted transglutaminase-like cysteine proteinase